MTEPLAFTEPLDPAWLTNILKAHGALAQGAVLEVNVQKSYQTGPSQVAHLALRYTDDAGGQRPEKLFLKIPKPHKYGLGRNEVRFYQQTARRPHLVPCYAAAYDDQKNHAYLLLADLSQTHRAGGALSLEKAQRAVDALAAVQAPWWDHPDLGRQIGAPPEEGFCHKYSDRHDGNRRRFGQLVDLHGEAVGPAVRALYETVLEKGPDVLLERAASGI